MLHLSTRWDFASLRKLALKSIRPPTSHDQLVLARTYSVEEWVLPALTTLCSRSLPLSLDEARQMDIEDVILVAAVREEIRDGALRVDVADIPHCVEAAQAGELDRLVGYRAKAEAKTETTHGAEAKAQAEAEAKKNREGAIANADADAMAKTEADTWENAKQEAKAKAEAHARGTEEANLVKASWMSQMTAAVAKAELEAKEKEKAEIETEAKAGAEGARAEREDSEEVRKRAEAQIAKLRAADKAARVSPGHGVGWIGTSTVSPYSLTGEPNPPAFGSLQNSWARRTARNSKAAIPAKPAGGMGV